MIPSAYDVADYSPNKIGSDRTAYTLVQELRWCIWRSSSPLLPPEKVVRDYCNFDAEMGNGFATLIGYCGGPETFARGLLAVEAISATEHMELMERAKRMMEVGGLEFPDPLPEPWWDPNDGYDNLPPAIESDLNDLDSSYWHLEEDGYLKLLEYIESQQEVLACRKGPAPEADEP